MNQFNLVDDPWISVLTIDNGEQKLVSLSELFSNTTEYTELAGDTATQDFAVLRIILSVVHTVFSRVNFVGEAYEFLDLDDKLLPLNEVDESDIDEYSEQLFETWETLWNSQTFSKIILKYLDIWKDHFNLFDDEYPFMQVTKKEISIDKISRANPSSISGKTVNRLVSESGNKIALFSPKYERKNNKSYLRTDQIIRWLITYHGYTGLSDKVIFGKEKYTASKGWLYDIGGLYFKGDNLFETILLNTILVHPREEYLLKTQRPSWEMSPKEALKTYFPNKNPDNLSELYTKWGRAVYIDPLQNLNSSFQMSVVKIPRQIHQNQFIEPMTLWKYNEKGDYANTFTPRKHQPNKALWRSFGLLSIPNSMNSNYQRPIIVDWLEMIEELVDKNITVVAISMEDDGNATSWVPVNELIDTLHLNDMLLIDNNVNGWATRINNIVEETKQSIEIDFKRLLNDILVIRNIKDKSFVNKEIQKVYSVIDRSFKEWISNIDEKSSYVDKSNEWRQKLKKILLNEVYLLLTNATMRDFKGREVDGYMINLPSAANKFGYFLNKRLFNEEG